MSIFSIFALVFVFIFFGLIGYVIYKANRKALHLNVIKSYKDYRSEK